MKSLILILASIIVTAASEELTLHKAQELLFQNNLDIASKQKEVEKASWDLSEAHSLWYPSVDFYGNYTYLSEKNQIQYPPQFSMALPVLQQPISLGTNYKAEFGLDVSYPVFTGLSRIYNTNSRKWNKALTESSLEATRNKASYTLGLTYMRWYFSYQQQVVWKKHLSYLEEYLKQTQELSDGGVVAPVKVIEARARFKAAQVDLLESVQQSDSIARELSDLIMINENGINPQSENFGFDSIKLPDSVDSTRAELEMIQFNENQLKESGKIISSQRLPALAAIARYRVANPGLNLGGDQFMDYFLFGVQLKWNIFNGFKNRAQRMEIEKQIENLQINESKNIDFWNRSLANYKMDLYRAQEKIDAANLSVKAADELVQSLAVSLRAGVVTSVDYLYALNSLASAELKLQQAIFQKRISIINALYASGTVLQF